MQQFGDYIRATRERLYAGDKTFSLRQVARRINIEPAYLSKIERGLFPPPSEDVIVKLAQLLGEDKDVLLAMAGKLSSDLRRIILKRPQLFGELLRELKNAPEPAILRVVREVKDGKW